MSTPITTASPPELCPDCQRPTGTNPPSRTGCCYLHLFGGDDGKPGYQMHLLSCQTVTIARLRLELSKAQGGLTATERAVVDAAMAWADGGTKDGPLEAAIRRLRVARERTPKPEKKESE